MPAGFSGRPASRTSSPAARPGRTSASTPMPFRNGSNGAAWRSIRSRAPSSTRRSWTSGTTPATRSPSPASSAFTRAAITRSMATAESTAGEGRPSGERRWSWAALALVLGGGLALRLWGVGQGLPYAYNTDEGDHFLPRAVEMFAHGTLNPHYFANPPGFTYVLHFLFAIYYGGAAAVIHAYAHHPGELYTLGRIAAALLGTIAVWLLYLVGARLLGRAAGLLAAAIEAVAFLPVFYAHLALNDAPVLAPLTLSL